PQNARDFALEEFDASVERLVKCFLFAANGFLDCFLFRADFGEDIAHRLCDHNDKLEEKRFVKTKRAAVTNGATKNTTQNVSAAFVRRNDSIRNRKRERADVIGDHAEGDVDFLLLAIDCRAAASAALFDRQAMRLPYNWQRAGIFSAA